MITESARSFRILVLQATTMVFATISPFLEGSVWSFHWPKNTVDAIACIFSSVGLVLAVSAGLSLGSSLTASPIPKEQGQLIIKGPYSLMRNPIYVGAVLMYVGWGLWFRSPSTFVWTALLFLVVWRKVIFEEKELLQKFGRAYSNYCRQTKRFTPW